jgi:hypothetical protein
MQTRRNFMRLIPPAVLCLGRVYMSIWIGHLFRTRNWESGYIHSSTCMKKSMTFRLLTKRINTVIFCVLWNWLWFYTILYDINLNFVRMTRNWLCINPLGISEDSIRTYGVWPGINTLIRKLNLSHWWSEVSYWSFYSFFVHEIQDHSLTFKCV